MINLEVFFKNHFDTKEISDDKLRMFAEVHLQRVAANNPGGIYTARITATTTAFTNYFGAISSEDIKFSIQQGLTITMNDALKDFIKNVQQKQGTIQGNWGKSSSQYQEFFPYGLTEYTHATLLTAPTLMNRMVAAATAHVADLGQPFVDLFTELRTTFQDARTAQLVVMGEVEGLKDTSEANRNILEVELMTNLLFIAMNNIGQPDKMKTYFNQSIIRPKVGTTATFSGDLAVAEIKYIDTGDTEFEGDTDMDLESTATTTRYYFLATQGGTPGPGDPYFDVHDGQKIPKKASDIGYNETRKYLHAQNAGVFAGQYKAVVHL